MSLLRVRTLKSVPARPHSAIVIYDKKLLTAVPGFRDWIRKFPFSFPVQAGEKLKSLSSFARECERIHARTGHLVNRGWTVIAIGGGSVGDFAGFFASVYKRGLRLMHMPTTWLAAVDSSHGGKTALNLSGAKNQIGTFYLAEKTILVRSILDALPDGSEIDARGEVAKIVLLSGVSRFGKGRALWSILPTVIEQKMKIVRLDPEERNGTRRLLNLGHTWGHVIEAETGLTHGKSVGQGLYFSVDLSEARGILKSAEADRIRLLLSKMGIERDRRIKVAVVQARKLLLNDKKRGAGRRIWFVGLRKIGRPVQFEVEVDEVLEIARSNGWLR